MRICCPLSSVTAEPSGNAPGTARARPPTLRAASKTGTLRPPCAWARAAATRPPPLRAASKTVPLRPACAWAMAAAMPAQPAPMTATFIARPGPPVCPEARRGGAPAKVGQGRAGGDATVGRPYLLHAPQRVHLPRQPELAQRCQADALVQHLEVLMPDLAQQRAVDAGHHQAGLLR